MKKLLLVNNNMKIGGVQKSLQNLLWAMVGRYELTLCLFCATGAYLAELPAGVRVISCGVPLRALGLSQRECRAQPLRYFTRGALALGCRAFGRGAVLPLLLRGQPALEGRYDCAVSFLHNGAPRQFYGGVNEFVLEKVNAARKVAFVHCDYARSGANCAENNALYARFDAVAACSDGCRESFLRAVPELSARCVTVPNFHRYETLRALARTRPYPYPFGAPQVLMVGRLAREKGVDRAILALRHARARGIPAVLHLVGGGPEEAALRRLARELRLQDAVLFHGEQTNPYCFMQGADLLLVASRNEAAPMVIDEARALALPVLTTATVSSAEMVTGRGCGWVCENSQTALNAALCSVLRDGGALRGARARLAACCPDNALAIRRFTALVEGCGETGPG